MTRRLLDVREVPAVLRQAVGDYGGRSFAVVVSESVTLSGAYWDGGSRTVWRAVELATGRVAFPGQALTLPPQFGGPGCAPTVPIPAGWCVVAVDQGRFAGVTFHVRPDAVAALLPAPASAAALSPAARAVLVCTVTVISRARRDMAARDYGVRGPAYDSALAECRALGYVNAQGAATVSGRNLAEVVRRELDAERFARIRATREGAA